VPPEIPLLGDLLEPALGHPDRDLLLEPPVDLLAFEQRVPTLERPRDGPAEVVQGRWA